MADIKPFVCVRPAEDVVSAVAALPYDVYNREEAKEVVAKNPKSFLAIDRAETQFPDDVDTYDDRVYAKAAQMLKDWIADGTFIRDNRECYYIYELTMDGRTQTGIAACASIDDYANQVIKKHENTRADKEQDLSLIHISEPTRRTPISYAVFCLKKKRLSICLLYTFRFPRQTDTIRNSAYESKCCDGM